MSKYKGTKTLEVLEGADNYNKWIAETIRPFIKSPALEIGAGLGNISEQLAKIRDLTLSDIDPNLVAILQKKFISSKNIRVEIFDISKTISTVKSKFNSIYSVNVLEHIKDDKKALRNMNTLLSSGGRVVLLVPAKKSVYSKIDKRLGHFRRYEREELILKMKGAGFSNIKVEYFNALGLLSWYVRDKIDRNNNHLKPSHVKAFDVIVPILKAIEPKKNLPFGISLIAVGIKK